MFALSLPSPPWWRGRSPHGRSPPRPRGWSEERAAGLTVWWWWGRGHTEAALACRGSAGCEASRCFVLQIFYFIKKRQCKAEHSGKRWGQLWLVLIERLQKYYKVKCYPSVWVSNQSWGITNHFGPPSWALCRAVGWRGRRIKILCKNISLRFPQAEKLQDCLLTWSPGQTAGGLLLD